MPNHVIYHLHSDSGSLLDSATKFEMYLDKAVEYGMKAIGFSEHGNVMHWIKKKQECEKRGLKYIHGMEAYVTESLNEKIRDNYHMIFIAKNWEGVKELNKMSSKGFAKEDGHFYYDARFTLDEVFNTSDNIMITTSCLGGLLWKGRHKPELIKKFLSFAHDNKHRVFLEIQYHNHPEQIAHNQWLYRLSLQHGFKLISGTDTHSLNEDYAMARRILMQAKGIQFQDEDTFDLTFKSYDEVVKMYEVQGAISKSAYLEAIEFTNEMADMVEDFQLDTTPKYPKLYENAEEVFKEKINIGFKERGINDFPKEKRQIYINRIKEEFDTYKKVGAIDYMLLQEKIINWAHQNGIYQGYGRGSVNGSLIAYLLKITEMDSIKHKLNFFRFLNPERISLADIDVDWPPSRRQEVIDYVASIPNIYFSEIITFNTVALKGAIREVGRALKMDLDVVDTIAKSVYKDENKKDVIDEIYREKYPELFKYVDLLIGVNVSVGSHPSGFVVSPIPLDEYIGTFYTSESKYPVSQVNMKELDSCNFVKLDILGLDNIEIINETCKLADIERLTPDNVDVNDEKVWNSIKDSGLGIFQWESASGQEYLKRLFAPETIKKIKEINSEISLIELFSIGNAAIRPSGESYRDNLANGIFKDHGHNALNESLKNTLGYLVSQEQIMKFLVEFCGFSMAESDSVRRGLAKKEGTENFLPEIKNRFIKTMQEKYGESKEKANEIIEPFLQVILDAQHYGFSDNHSMPYSFIGYICGYLRYYYPLEFLTVMLNINKDNIEKTAKIVEYAATRGIKILPIQFRKSRANYSFSKEENAIYKGIESIKYLNQKIADELYELKNKQYDYFVELLADIENYTSVDSRQLQTLIKLNFFKDFGENNELLRIYKEFSEGKNRYKKGLKDGTKEKRLELLREKETEIKNSDINKKLPIIDQILFEKEVLGYSEVKKPDLKNDYYCVLEIDTKYSPKITLYNLKTGDEMIVKISKNDFYSNGKLFDVGTLIKNVKIKYKNKMKPDENGNWIESDVKEPWLIGCNIVKQK